jgi:hypothetical protein
LWGIGRARRRMRCSSWVGDEQPVRSASTMRRGPTHLAIASETTRRGLLRI